MSGSRKKKLPGKADSRAGGQKKTTRRGSVAGKLLLLALGMALICLVELVVRLLPLENAWQPKDDPFVGFSEVHPLFVPAGVEGGRTMMETAHNKQRWFNLQRFPRTKAPGTIRVFSLGGSTTYGHPYADETSFSGWLRKLLEGAKSADRGYEVINAGGISYASYRIVKLVEELLEYDPDLFVIKTGHNEFLEARTYPEFYEKQGSLAAEVRQALSRLETYRLLDGLFREIKRGLEAPPDSNAPPAPRPSTLTAEVETILDRVAGLDLYHRDSTFSRGVFEHFDYNIGRIKQLCREDGVAVLFLEPVDNLKDFSPFKSEENSRLDPAGRRRLAESLGEGMKMLSGGLENRAVGLLREAVATDSLFAAGHFYLGQALLANGDTSGAARCFFNARELDVCPLRAQQPIHDILRRHTSGKDDPDLILLPQLFAGLSPGGIIGDETLIDHIHPYPEGHLRIALEVLDWMRDEGMAPAEYNPSEQEVATIFKTVMDSLPEEYYQKGLLNLTKVLLWARKYREALVVLDFQWEIMRNVAQAQYLVGTIMEQMGDSRAALEHLHKALELEEDHLLVLGMMARVYTSLGQNDSAAATYEKVLRYYPDDPGILSDYGVMLSISGEKDRALQTFQKARRLKPDMPGLNNNIGMIHYMAGENQAALEAFGREIEVNPGDGQAYFNIGTTFARMEQYEQAGRYFLQALERNPSMSAARINLANVYRRQGKPDEAESMFSAALANDPTQLEAYLGLADMYQESGRLEEIRRVAHQGLKYFPKNEKLIRLAQN